MNRREFFGFSVFAGLLAKLGLSKKKEVPLGVDQNGNVVMGVDMASVPHDTMVVTKGYVDRVGDFRLVGYSLVKEPVNPYCRIKNDGQRNS